MILIMILILLLFHIVSCGPFPDNKYDYIVVLGPNGRDTIPYASYKSCYSTNTLFSSSNFQFQANFYKYNGKLACPPCAKISCDLRGCSGLDTILIENLVSEFNTIHLTCGSNIRIPYLIFCLMLIILLC